MARTRGAARFTKALDDPSLPETRVIPVPAPVHPLRGDRDPAAVEPVPPVKFVWDEYFSAERPVEADIGCGKGRFFLSRARENPGVDYLGVERDLSRINCMDYTARSEGLDNFFLMRADALPLVTEIIPDGVLRAVHFFFPDPWPKRKHHKNRLFKDVFVDGVFRILIPGGLFHVATDRPDYFGTMEKTLDSDPRFERIETLVREPRERTDFEVIFLSKNLPTFGASYRKKG